MFLRQGGYGAEGADSGEPRTSLCHTAQFLESTVHAQNALSGLGSPTGLVHIQPSLSGLALVRFPRVITEESSTRTAVDSVFLSATHERLMVFLMQESEPGRRGSKEVSRGLGLPAKFGGSFWKHPLSLWNSVVSQSLSPSLWTVHSMGALLRW